MATSFRRLFQSRIFRYFWIGEAISVLGDQFYLLALPWLTLQLTDSPEALGTVLMAAAIPRAVLMPVGGLLVDRFSPQHVLLLSNVARGLIVTTVTALLLRDAMQLWHIYVLSIAFGAADALSFPAFMSLTPRLVEEHLLEAGNAVVQGTQQFAAMIGPAIAGVVISSVGVSVALGIDALSFWVSVATLVMVIRLSAERRKPSAAPAATAAETPAAPAAAPPGGIGEAVRYVLRDPVLRTVLVILAAINFGVLGPIGVGLPALVHGPLGGGATMLGLVMGASGAGTLVGMATAALRKRPERPGPVTSLACGLLALGIGAVSVTAQWPQLLPALLVVLPIASAALGYLNVQGISWLQARLPQAMMGRVMAIMVLAGNGLSPISYVASGHVAAASLPLLFVGGGVAVGLAFLATRGAAFRRVSMTERLAM